MDMRSVAFQMKTGRIPVRFRAHEPCFRLLRDRHGRMLLSAPRELGTDHARSFLRGWADAEALPLREENDGRLLGLAMREAPALAERLRVPVPALALTGGPRVWGVCRLKEKVILLHRGLSRMPDAVAREVLCHELCHLREPDHSAAFWRMMDESMPDWPALEGMLRCLGERMRAGRN